MVINGSTLLSLVPIENMELEKKIHVSGTSYGLSENGYDIRLKQDIEFVHSKVSRIPWEVRVDGIPTEGKFTIASTIEKFKMPDSIMGIVHDKSTWARQGLSVFNTVIESGWEGFLTLELVYHGNSSLHLPRGCGIAQVVFHTVTEAKTYTGKYQNQPDEPVKSIWQKNNL